MNVAYFAYTELRKKRKCEFRDGDGEREREGEGEREENNHAYESLARLLSTKKNITDDTPNIVNSIVNDMHMRYAFYMRYAFDDTHQHFQTPLHANELAYLLYVAQYMRDEELWTRREKDIVTRLAVLMVIMWCHVHIDFARVGLREIVRHVLTPHMDINMWYEFSARIVKLSVKHGHIFVRFYLPKDAPPIDADLI